jgi:hypothetical protein
MKTLLHKFRSFCDKFGAKREHLLNRANWFWRGLAWVGYPLSREKVSDIDFDDKLSIVHSAVGVLSIVVLALEHLVFGIAVYRL